MITISNALATFALSWSLTSLLATKPLTERKRYRDITIAAFIGFILLVMTCQLFLVVENLLEVKYNEMTQVEAFKLYLVELACWIVFVLPQSLIVIYELNRKR